MWLIHIDTWNYPDPQQIIDLIPGDIRPWVVMDISMSINHDANGKWLRLGDGYETAKSWLRTCAENNMWAMIQPSSGGYSHFSDYDLSVYEEFYREYPNFIGFNYCEQFWGFDDPPLSPPWQDRITHFANLLELSHKYGGYLVVSMCWNQWGPSINPIAQLKRNAAFAAACRDYTENYILCEKYTQQGYQHDMESICLGAYLSGYAGQYGIRYDSTGWTDSTKTGANFSMATGGAPHLEHIMLTGETVIDGPELIWTQCFRGISNQNMGDGFSRRAWSTFPQFDNVSIDLFRKITDGTVRIPTRQEVIGRTKVVITQNVSMGSDDDIYSTPSALFDGLYNMPGYGSFENDMSFFKSTGRYPTIPVVYALDDAPAQSFQLKLNKSALPSRWPTISAKVTEFDSLFPQEYTGNIFAGRHENGWVIYNPFKTTNVNGAATTGNIPFKYNTCDSVDLSLAQYTSGVMKETANQVTFYLNNHDNELGLGMRTDTIAIHGASTQPLWSHTDRGTNASVVTPSWSGGVFTLTVQHNGPLDITINCSGTATGRLTYFTPATIMPPAPPLPYPGMRQYEGEVFEFKNISGIDSNAAEGTVTGFTGQGFLRFGGNSAAAVRKPVSVPNAGIYRLQTRYSLTGGDVNSIQVWVNGANSGSPTFTNTGDLSMWNVIEQNITLNAGTNMVEFRAVAGTVSTLYFDNFVLVPTAYSDGLVIQENEEGFLSVNGTIDSNHPGYTGTGFANTNNAAGTGVEWAIGFDSSVTKGFIFRYAATNDRSGDLYVNGLKVAGNIQFPSTGSWSTWDYVHVYASVPAGSSLVRLEATSAAGLPNLDSMEVAGGTIWSPGSAPFDPIGLTATGGAPTQINLSWSNTPGADTYTVRRATVSGGPYSTVATGVTGTSYSDTGLTELTTYYYVLSATNVSGTSGNSAEADAKTGTSQPPAAPTGLAANSPWFDQIDLSWSAVLGADSYSVKRSTVSGGPYTTLATGLTGTNFSNIGLSPGTSYFYVVSATNAIAEGANSAELNAWTTSTVKSAPMADTYVRDGGSATSNFGTSDKLAAKWDGNVGSGFNRTTFMKFDVSQFGTADSVILKLTPFQVDGGTTLDYELVTDDSWTETAATWNNQPSGSGNVVASVSGYTVGQEISIDVTAAAVAQAAGDGILSLRISNRNAVFVGFSSKESAFANLRPSLECTLPSGPTPPPAPTGLAASAVSTSQINLSWNASAGADSYSVKRATISGGPYTTVAIGVSGTSFHDTGMAASTTYYYVVSAVNAGGEGANSSQASATTHATPPPAAPTGLAATAVEPSQIHLSWNASIGATSYNVKRAATSGGPYTVVATGVSGTSFNDSGLSAITTYYYVVSAVNTGGEGANSSQASATTQAIPPPAGLAATAISPSQIDLAWSDSSGATSYNVKRSTGSGGPYTTVATGLGVTGYSDGGLSAGTTYYYVVSAVGAGGESANSAEANATTQSTPPPVAPSGLVTTAVSISQVDLSWTASSGGTGYNVKWSPTSGGPYTTIATGVVATSYSDFDLYAGSSNYYVVSAVGAGGESANSAEAVAVTPELVAHLAFDESSGTTAADASPNGFDGTLVNGPQWATGLLANSVLLDGVDDHVTLSPGVVANMGDFTIGAWVYLNSVSSWSRVFDFGTGTSNYMFLTPSSGGGGPVRYAITTGSGEQQINGSTPLPLGQWVHVAVTLSGSTGILYVDGVEVGNNTGMTLDPSALGTTTQNYIGRSQFADPYLDGAVDDFQIIGRALSTTEISTMATPPVTGPIDDHTSGEIPVSGTVTGSHANTQTSDNVYESIREIESGGKTSTRYSYLEHKWTIDVTGGDTVTFNVEAYKTANSEGDNFVFAYSTDNVNFSDMLTVTKTSDDNVPQSYVLPASLSGTVYIRVRDTNRSRGNRMRDTVYIDDLYITSD